MIHKDMTIIEVLNTNRNTAAVFSSYGMGCIGCLISHNETVEEAAQAHNINLDELLKKLNEACK